MESSQQPASTASVPASSRAARPAAVNIYPFGTITDRGNRPAFLILKKGRERLTSSRRSAITTFSRASAARLRRLLATTSGPDGATCYGVTLTVPGPVITPEECRRLWNAFRLRILRLNTVAIIWRIELQERQQAHFHCICWSTESINIAYYMRQAWLDNLGILGPVEGPYGQTADGKKRKPFPYSEMSVSGWGRGWYTDTTARVEHRALWPGAELHAVKIGTVEQHDFFAWWRYLAGHASKAKQAQLGWQGRQWGVVHKALLQKPLPGIFTMNDRQMIRAIRVFRRLTRCRFASGHGRQAWFLRPETTRKVCLWALSPGSEP
jgi:hypothetical protein